MTDVHPDPAGAGLADLLDGAALRAEAADRPPTEPTLAVAYAVQREMLRRRVATGARQVGVKLGFTSRAKMEQMGVDSVIAGFLLDSHEVADGASLDRGALIHPRVEPEIAFRISRDVAADEPVEDVLAAVDAVAPALEVIDSRYRDFHFRLGDVIADNTSAARFVVGEWQPVPDDLSDLEVTMRFDGAEVARGSTAAILGDPWEALRELRGLTEATHLGLRKGAIVLAGAATEALPLPVAGEVQVSVHGLGEARLGIGGLP